MSITIDMTGRVVLVTGGGRGVGDGIVASYLAAGADVEICGRNEPETLRELDGRGGEHGGGNEREEKRERTTHVAGSPCD